VEKSNPPLKLDEAWDAYLKSQYRPRSGTRTLSGYESHYVKFCKWIKGAFPEAVYMKDIEMT
jgi:hypothetical protein